MTEKKQDRYDALMEVVRSRMTNRAFAPCEIPKEHFELVLEAARHGPSGANCQPWHYIIVTNPTIKQKIGQLFVEEQQTRAALKMGFPTPNYNGMKTAPGFIVVATDYRLIRAFPTLKDNSDLAQRYERNAKSILLQSVAASTMSAHLAAAALGYAVSPIDIMCFGPPLKPSYKRWKKRLDQIANWDRLNPDNVMSDEEIDLWIKTTRHKVMYKDESKID